MIYDQVGRMGVVRGCYAHNHDGLSNRSAIEEISNFIEPATIEIVFDRSTFYDELFLFDFSAGGVASAAHLNKYILTTIFGLSARAKHRSDLRPKCDKPSIEGNSIKIKMPTKCRSTCLAGSGDSSVTSSALDRPTSDQISAPACEQ
jgi:hypothetical protein